MKHVSCDIAVIGAGYVGLVTAVCFAKRAGRVVLVEQMAERLAQLRRGIVPFHEPGLEELLQEVIEANQLIFASSIHEALLHTPPIIFSCVGTPTKDDGSVDLLAVNKVVAAIGASVKTNTLLVTKSTVPVGTARRIKRILHEAVTSRSLNITVDVASNPEFLREGRAIHDFMSADRIIIGIESDYARDLLSKAYHSFITRDDQLIEMNFESAELTKYAANTMLAMRISFINQFARLADVAGADINQICAGIGSDKRIGKEFLQAGVGYGGSCFPKDVSALIAMGQQLACPMTLAAEVERVNNEQRSWFVERILQYYGGNLVDKVAGIWGVSFKPNTDDIRCAPAIDLIKRLKSEGAHIILYDPVAMPRLKETIRDGIKYAREPEGVLEAADFLAIMTEWEPFLAMDPQKFSSLRDRLIFDGRNCFDPLDMQMHDLQYFCVGRNLYADQSLFRTARPLRPSKISRNDLTF